MNWREVIPGVYRFQDSCNVYAVQGSEGMLVIDAGTGRWLDHVSELPAAPAALALTHYFRDHAAGAVPAAARGIPVYVPEHERAVLADPGQHFRARETYVIYDNLWNLFAPIEPVAVAGLLRDYDRMRLAGLEVEVIPLPGCTLTQVGLAVAVPGSDRPVVFCGEAIHSPGRVPRVAPFQYNYNDMSGAGNAWYSAHSLRRHEPAALMPSLGEPILDDTGGALSRLEENLRAMLAPYRYGDPGPPGRLEKVTDHVYLDTDSGSNNWFVISDSGKALVIDYGYYSSPFGSAFPGYSSPPNRRPLLHGLEALQRQFGIDRIDVALISHFHDDHVCGLPLLQRLFGTEVWAAENFADLIAHPEAHCFPCNWHQPARVDRRIRLDEEVEWEEYRFHFGAMSGHTRFASLIGFEADGMRFAHTGDQYFFDGDFRNWSENQRMQNHVYRNGALLNGYAESGRWMLEWRPQVVIQGHQPPFFTDDGFFAHIEKWREEYETLHRNVMPLGEEEVHFDLDSWGGWIWPYRVHLAEPGPARVKVTVRNPLPRPADLEVALVGPQGWRGESATLQAGPRREVSCELSIVPDGPCRRQPFAVDLVAGGRPFGQVAEALMTVGGEEF